MVTDLLDGKKWTGAKLAVAAQCGSSTWEVEGRDGDSKGVSECLGREFSGVWKRQWALTGLWGAHVQGLIFGSS